MSYLSKNQVSCLDEALSFIKRGESVSIIAMPGAAGLSFIFNAIELELYKQLRESKKILVLHAKTRSDLESFLELHAQELNENTILLCGIFAFNPEEDSTWFIEKLYKFQTNPRKNMQTVLVTTISDCYQGIKQNNRLITQNLISVGLLDKNEALSACRFFSENYSLGVSPEQYETIISLSGGHIGLVKALTFLANEHGAQLTKKALEDSRVLHWLRKVSEKFDQNVLRDMAESRPLPLYMQDLLKGLGYIQNGELFSPLFKQYIRNLLAIAQSTPKTAEQLLTGAESRVYAVLREKENRIVSKDEVAQAIWGDEWKKSYSDWALTQIIYRLRKKVPEIKTKKGAGYYIASYKSFQS